MVIDNHYTVKDLENERTSLLTNCINSKSAVINVVSAGYGGCNGITNTHSNYSSCCRDKWNNITKQINSMSHKPINDIFTNHQLFSKLQKVFKMFIVKNNYDYCINCLPILSDMLNKVEESTVIYKSVNSFLLTLNFKQKQIFLDECHPK